MIRSRMLVTALVFALGLAVATPQPRPTGPQPRRGVAENQLAGVRLYDTGQRIVQLFGTPDDIQALSWGTAGAAAQGGGGAGAPTFGAPGGGGPGGGIPTGGAGGGAGGAAPPAQEIFIPEIIGDPFETGSSRYQTLPGEQLRQLRPTGAGGAAPVGGGPAPGASPAGPAPGPGAPGAGAAAAGGGGASNIILFTRWVYNRGPARYGFVFDRFMRVIQIEAIGLSEPRVRTRRGITLGSTFSDIIRKYDAPDGYEISGQTIVVRYLVRDRVAFRLSRVEANKPHRVTGIVVAAGKP